MPVPNDSISSTETEPFYDPHHVSHGHDKTVMIQNIGIKFRNIAAAKQRMGKGMKKKHPHIFMKISRLAVTLTTAGMQLPEMMQKEATDVRRKE